MKNKKYILEIIGAVVLLIATTIPTGIMLTSYAEQCNPNTIVELTFTFGQPQIEEINVSDETYHKISIEGLPVYDFTGEPELPYQTYSLLMPQRGVLDSVDVTFSGNTTLGDGYNVLLGPVMTTTLIDQLPDNLPTYCQSTPYPTELCTNLGISDYRGYSILTFNINPVHYIGEQGLLYYYQEISITLTITEDGSISPLFRDLAVDRMMMEQKIDDSRFVDTYTITKIPFNSSIVNPADTYKYVIITTEQLKNSDFQLLKNHKENQGISTTIVTKESILLDPFYNTDPYFYFPVADTQERIRNFIRDAYLNWETEYILLGGDHDFNIPARKVDTKKYGMWIIEPYLPMPCDLYYSCLDGSWDSNGNGVYGEMDSDHVDLLAEIYIGRACVSNSNEVTNFVSKTLAYESTTDSYLEEVNLAGEKLDWQTWGGDSLDELIDGSDHNDYVTIGIPSKDTYPNDGYIITKLYDRDLPQPWEISDITSVINNGVHIVCHDGHSFFNRNMRIDIYNVSYLTNDDYCFMYSSGCMAGGFDNPLLGGFQMGKLWPPIFYDCIAEYLTIKSAHGAFAGIWNCREGSYHSGGTDSQSQRYVREFFDAVFGESKGCYRLREIGIANQDSKEDVFHLAMEEPVYRWNYYTLHLFGDPQTILKPAVIPAHDVLVEYIDVPKYFAPGRGFDVSTVIFNIGSSTENNVVVCFKVYDSYGQTVVEQSETVNSLEHYERAVVDFSGCILPEGTYEVHINIEPITGEQNTTNNILIQEIESDYPPSPPSILGPTNGHSGITYNYTVNSVDPDGDDVFYLFDWGDGSLEGWLGPHDSGADTTYSHRWKRGSYTIRVKAKNIYGVESDWGTFVIQMPYVYLSGCTQGTHVSMAVGSGVESKTIETLQSNDLIKSYDTLLQQIVPARVVEILEYNEDSPENYLIINNNLQVTQEHLLYLNQQNWGEARYAKIGDNILTITPSKLGINDQMITSIETVDCDQQIIIYDLVLEPLEGEACGYWANNILVSGIPE